MTGRAKGRKVVGLGLGVLDHLLLWEDMSRPVQGNRIVRYEAQGGGMVATAIVAVARLGGQAEFWGAVGDDWMADLILRQLRDEGVDVSNVLRVPASAGPMVVVCVDRPTGERHFLHFIGPPEPPGPIGVPDRLASAGCLLLDGTHADSALAAARRARDLGVPVVGDVGGIGERMRGLLGWMDYAIASESCASRLAGGDDPRRACEALHELGPRHVVVTLGPRGLAALSEGQFIRMNAYPVRVVDTTGAGDVFHGAFCLGLTEGMSLQDNLAFSSAVAALKCRKLGGRAGIPSRVEVEQFLKERPRP